MRRGGRGGRWEGMTGKREKQSRRPSEDAIEVRDRRWPSSWRVVVFEDVAAKFTKLARPAMRRFRVRATRHYSFCCCFRAAAWSICGPMRGLFVFFLARVSCLLQSRMLVKTTANDDTGSFLGVL